MPVKMIALRKHYSTDDSKEYGAGESFMVPSDREADRLERMRRAKRDAVKAEPAPKAAKAQVETKVMVAEEPPVVVAHEEPKTEEPENPMLDTGGAFSGRGKRYRRNDMRSED